jgi:threonine-phosphate decarboxylase
MMHEIDPAEHGGKIKRFLEDGYSLIDFSASVNPLPPTLDLSIDCAEVCFYPDVSYTSLKKVIAAYHECTPDQVAVGNGSVELIRLICMMTLNVGDLVCTSAHTFGEYGMSARLCGASITHEPHGARLHFICNPENPTGELLQKEHVLECIFKNSQDSDPALIVIDEAFIDLADPCASVIPCIISREEVVVLRSLTKSFGMPGIRFGYAIGEATIIRSIETLRTPWSVNALSEKIAKEAFARMDELAVSREYIKKEREFMISSFESAGFECSNAAANYILIQAQRSAAQITTDMINQGFLVRDCTSFGLPHSIRVAVRLHEENMALIEALIPCLSL